jgi:ribonucleoside-triphosphate reductase
MFVKKRDGRKQKFNQDKIINAVQAAFIKVDGELTKQATDKSKEIAKYIESLNKTMDVEEIQDIVESKLMASSRKDVAKEYVLYRAERTRERNKRSEFNKRIGEKLTASNVQNSNANMDEYSFGGRVGEAASELTKDYALDNLISEKARYNHENNIVYIHDLNSYAVGLHNCLSIPFDDLLKNGFNTRQQSIRPAGSISSAFQLIAVIMQCQSLVHFGGVAATHIDWSLVPYVRKSLFKHYVLEAIKDSDEFDNFDIINSSIEDVDNWIKEHKDEYLNNFNLKEEDFFIGSDKLDKKIYKKALFETIKEADQAVEGMFHNLNSLQSRSGNQLPFSSICYGTCTLEEGRLITKAILENSIKGGGKLHSTYIFPCQIFKIAKGINKEPNTPNYDLYRLALKSTTLRLYPNYANVDWSVNSNADKNNIDEEMATMGKVEISPCKTL